MGPEQQTLDSERARCGLRWASLITLTCLVPLFPLTAAAQKDTWETLNATGIRAYQQARFPYAKQWFEQALDEAQGSGQANPRLAATLYNLAAVHEAMGEYEAAELRYRHWLAVVEDIQGPDHPDLVQGLKSLISLYERQANPSQAEPLLHRALQILELALGADHPHLAPDLMRLAFLSQVQRKYDDAERLYARALNITKTGLGPDHPQVAVVLLQYATLFRATNRENEAVVLEERAKAIRLQENTGTERLNH